MRIVVTGGGTGGHVLPALEVATHARDLGDEVLYVGSRRGQEGKACRAASIRFEAIGAVPLGRLYTPGGIAAGVQLLRACASARTILQKEGAQVVFSTGGYAASPVLTAAKTLGIPVIIHEQNTVPGRTHRIASRFAKRVCVLFEEAKVHFSGKGVRTGMPIRKPILEAARRLRNDAKTGISTLSLGGSQGAAALNEAVLTAVLRINGPDNRWLHISGEKLYESLAKAAEKLGSPPGYVIKPYLEACEMADALAGADIAVARSGAGVLAELALFGIPMILVPYPYAHAQHQHHNAKVIEKMGGGVTIPQRMLTPENLESYWRAFADCSEKRRAAERSLKEWTIRDATERVYDQIKEVMSAN